MVGRRLAVVDWINPGCSTTKTYCPVCTSSMVNCPSESVMAEYCAADGPVRPFNCTFAFLIGWLPGSCRTLPRMLNGGFGVAGSLEVRRRLKPGKEKT